MPGTAKDKVAAANARAADAGNKQSGAAAAASSSQELAEGKKKKSNITSRIKKFFTPRNRMNSKSVGENEGNQSMNPNGAMDQSNPNEPDGALSQSRLLSVSHECVFTDDQTSPVKLMPAHHKSMEAVSGNFAADLDKKIQQGPPLVKKSVSKGDEQPRPVPEHRTIASGESVAVEQAFFQPWAASSSKSEEADLTRNLSSLDAVGSSVGALASVSQKSRRDVRQKNKRPVTVIGGQKLRSKPDAVLVMPDQLTEESDADDVGGTSGPVSISSISATRHPAATDSKPHHFQKKGDSRKEMLSPVDGGGLQFSLVQPTNQSDGSVRSTTPLTGALTGSLTPSDDSLGDKHLLAGKHTQQALTVDVSAAQHYAATTSHSPSVSLLSSTTEKTQTPGQVSPNMKTAEVHANNISTSGPGNTFLANESNHGEQSEALNEEQHGKGGRPPITKPRPPVTAAKPSPVDNLLPAVSDSKTTPTSLYPKGGIRVFPVSPPVSNSVAADSSHSSAAEARVSSESSSTISIPRVSFTKHSPTTPALTSSESDSSRLADEIQVTCATDGFGISIPRAKLHNRSEIMLDSDSSNREPASASASDVSLKPSNVQGQKKEGVALTHADHESNRESGEAGEDILTSLKHLPNVATDKVVPSGSYAEQAAKRKSMVVQPTVAVGKSIPALNKRVSYHGGDSEEVFHGVDQSKGGVDEISQAFKRMQQGKEAKYVTVVDTASVPVVAADSSSKQHLSGAPEGGLNEPYTKALSGAQNTLVEVAEVESHSHSSEGSGHLEKSVAHKLAKLSGAHETSIEHKPLSQQPKHKADEHVTRVYVHERKLSSESSKVVISSKSGNEENEGNLIKDQQFTHLASKPAKAGLLPKPAGLRGTILGQTWSPGDLGSGISSISKAKDLSSTSVVREMPPVLRRISVPSKDELVNTADVNATAAKSVDTAGTDHTTGSEKPNKFLAGRRGGSLKHTSAVPSSREKDEMPPTIAESHQPTKLDQVTAKSNAAAKPLVNAATTKRSEDAAAAKVLEKMSSVDSSMTSTSNEMAVGKKKDAEDAAETEKATEERISNARAMFGERSKSMVAKGGSLRRVEGSVVAQILDESIPTNQNQTQPAAKKDEAASTAARAQSTSTTSAAATAGNSKKKEQELATSKADVEAAKSAELTSRPSFGDRGKSLVLKGGSLKKVEGSLMAKELASLASAKQLKEEVSEHAMKQQAPDAKNSAAASKADTDHKKTDVDQPATAAAGAPVPVTTGRAPSLGSRSSLKRSDYPGVVKTLDSMSSASGDKGGTAAAEKDKEAAGATKPVGRAESLKASDSSQQSSEPTWMAAARSKTANWNKNSGLGQSAPGEEPDLSTAGSTTPVMVGQVT